MRKFIVILYNLCDKIMNNPTEKEHERFAFNERNKQLAPYP